MRKIFIDRLDAFFDSVERAYKLFIPAETPTGAIFRERKIGDRFSDSRTRVSPKNLFFPQSENLMDFKVFAKNIEIIGPEEEISDFVLFGVKACDAKSFDVLDRVFLGEPRDTYYARKREKGTIVVIACDRPTETCFCGTFGIDPSEPAEGDAVVVKTSDAFYIEAKTEKGEKLLSLTNGYTEPAGESEVIARKELIGERMKRLPLAKLSVKAFGGGKTEVFFDRPEWKELSECCLGCGACTFVCPTCQCYDIKDYKTNDGVKRYRCWDSCMYSDFTKMSAGQPRLTQKERFRQRFMHKLVYYPENNDGLFSCVGCGRCVSVCPSRLNIVTVIKKLGGRSDDKSGGCGDERKE